MKPLKKQIKTDINTYKRSRQKTYDVCRDLCLNTNIFILCWSTTIYFKNFMIIKEYLKGYNFKHDSF